MFESMFEGMRANLKFSEDDQKIIYSSQHSQSAPLTPNGVPNYEKHETGQTHPIDLVPLPVEWTPDKWDGRPCCFLPHTPERLRGVIPTDLRGMRIPSNGLPPFLRGISACGWTLELSGGELHLKRAHPAARNEAGCLGYIRIHAKNVAADWRLWREVVRI